MNKFTHSFPKRKESLSEPEPVRYEQIGKNGSDPARELSDTCDLCGQKTQNIILHLQRIHPVVYRDMIDPPDP